MQIGYIGLGKMGLAQVKRLLEKGWRVVAWNRSEGPRKEARKAGAEIADTLEDICTKLKTPPRLVWLMVPHAVVDDVLKELIPHLQKEDTVIDGGNSFYKHSMRRAKQLSKKGIHFLDCGTSGGPSGARHGACLMVGGEEKMFKRYERLFKDLSASYSPFPKGSGRRPRDFKILRLADSPPPLGKEEYMRGSYEHVGRAGAGHFVKMVHNGIEYGMMQAIGEGFEVMKQSDFRLPLQKIANLYNSGSVIESKLIGWLAKAFKEHGENLKNVSGEVAHSGEGLWTVDTAKELGVPVTVIKGSLDFRVKSKGKPSYTGQVVSALRSQFGGHDVKKE